MPMTWTNLRTVLRSTADALLAVSLAPQCVVCKGTLDSPLAGVVCAVCWASIHRSPVPFCRCCGDPLPPWRCISIECARCARCRRLPRVLDAARASGAYEGTLREILHAFKYGGRRTLAIPLGALMRDAGSDLLNDADVAVPVPLHRWKQIQRGFNQAEDLARTLGVPCLRALRRRRSTAPQSELAADARRRNVDGAFSLSPFLTRRVRETRLAGRTVVLVDDVRTTGATLEACAQVLKSAGSARVTALTAARATLLRRP